MLGGCRPDLVLSLWNIIRYWQKTSRFHGKNLSSLLKESLIEKMEEEFDIKLLAEAKEYNKKHTETHTHEQVKKELGL